MKRTALILISLLAVLLLPACQKDLEERLHDLQNDVTNLEERVNKLNESITSLSSLIDALEKNDHISGVSSFTSEGKTYYKVSFTSGNTLFLSNGTDGVTPIVGVRYNEEYDAYYWTIQMGEGGKETWMVDSYGQRVRATGWVPRLKVEDGIWWYSFDGTYWSKAGWGNAQGASGSAVFKSIDTSNPYFVSFILANNSFFRLPTQFAIDEITDQCGRINDDIKTFTALVNQLDSGWFVKSVVSFEDPNGMGTGGIPDGLVMKDGQISYGSTRALYNGVLGFDRDHVLHVGSMTGQEALDLGLVTAVSFPPGPTLIKDGVKQTNLGGGVNPRTCVGQRADGAVLIAVIEGRHPDSLGATYDDLADLMEEFGAVNAGNLDGGSSSAMIYEGEQITKGSNLIGARPLATTILVLQEGDSN